MAKNARQRRAAKRNLALTLLALDRNPSTQPVEGFVRSGPASVNTLKGLTHTGVRVAFHSDSKSKGKPLERFKRDGWAGKGDLPTPPKADTVSNFPFKPDRTDGTLDKIAKADAAFAARLAKWRH